MERISRTIDAQDDGQRLDQFVTSVGAGLSRAEVQRQIRAGLVTVGGAPVRQPSRRLRAGDLVIWEPLEPEPLRPVAVPLDIVYEDDDLLAVNKPAGLVVHPGAGTAGTPTLVEGLLAARALPLSDDPTRPGIVHRIDKETSGILVVAKSDRALVSLKQQFAQRTVEKEYLAWVAGAFDESEGRIEAPVGRDPRAPRRMAVRSDGRDAETTFRVLATRGARSLLLVRPRTGRTHQIRVHLRYIGHPVVGDTLYGGPHAQALDLHAWRLTVRHPGSGARLTFEAPPPPRFPRDAYGALPIDRAASR